MRSWRLILFGLVMLLGIGLGLAYGWLVNPLTHAPVTLTALSSDYKTDAVLMSAEIYQADKNLVQASQRLAQLGSESPLRQVQQAIVSAGTLGYSRRDMELMAALAVALQSAPTGIPAITPGGTP